MLNLLVVTIFASFLSMASGIAAPIDKAVRAFEKKKYVNAIKRFDEIAKTSEQDNEAMEAANYFIGRSLYELGFRHAGIEYLYDIVKEAGNTDFIQSAVRTIMNSVENEPYDTSLILHDIIFGMEFDFLDSDLADFIHFQQGLHNKKQGFARFAKQHFAKIRDDSYYHYRVRYIGAVELLKRRRIAAAITELEEIINAEFKDKGVKDRARQTLARLDYEKKNFQKALDRYDSIESDLKKHASIFLEKGWTYLFLETFKEALGSLHALGAPIYSGFYDVEKYIIRMLIYKQYCMYPATRAVGADYEKDFGGALKAIKERQDLAGSDRLMGALYWSPDFKLKSDFLKNLEHEFKKLKTLSNIPSELKEKLVSIYDLKIKEMRQRIDSKILDGLQTIAEQLLKHDEQMSLLTYEVRLDELKRIKLFDSVKLSNQEKRPIAHGDRIYWPNDDEFWTDEIKDFRFLIENQCKSEVIR